MKDSYNTKKSYYSKSVCRQEEQKYPTSEGGGGRGGPESGGVANGNFDQ